MLIHLDVAVLAGVLYPRRLWLGEAAAFALGVEAVALATLLSAPSAVRGGAALCVSPRSW